MAYCDCSKSSLNTISNEFEYGDTQMTLGLYMSLVLMSCILRRH